MLEFHCSSVRGGAENTCCVDITGLSLRLRKRSVLGSAGKLNPVAGRLSSKHLNGGVIRKDHQVFVKFALNTSSSIRSPAK